jgi:ERCC4-related helicase
MKVPSIPTVKRNAIIEGTREVLSDGTARSAFQIAQGLQELGIMAGTLEINTVLQSDGRNLFRHDHTTLFYSLVHIPQKVTTPLASFQRLQRIRLCARPDLRGRIIDEPVLYDNGYQYLVMLSNGEEAWFAETHLEAVPLDGLPRWQEQEAFLRDIGLIKVQARFTDGIYMYKASRTEFVPYQFRPVLKFLRNVHQRILIADEVGLGKTIEAAIIYLELKARLNISRVLILCPSRLKTKWRDELRNRFEEDFEEWDSKKVRQFLEDTRRLGRSAPFKAIASFEMLRSPDFIDMWSQEQISLDLLIVDEAHYMRNQETRTYELGWTLCSLADAAVFLTATPLHLGNENLYNLLHMLMPGEFANFELFQALIAPNDAINRAARHVAGNALPQAVSALREVENTVVRQRFINNPYYHQVLNTLRAGINTSRDRIQLRQDILELNTLSTVFTRTKKREVSQAAVRAAYTLHVEFTPQERQFYEEVLSHVRRELQGMSKGAPSFAMIMRERQAASCLIALRETILESASMHKTFDLRAEQSVFDERTIETNTSVTQPRLIDLAQRLGTVDSKFDLFETTLRKALAGQADNKVLVFSFFRRTLGYLAHRLQRAGFKVAMLHGDVPVANRQFVIDQFRTDPSYQILLSSEVGAEGLDFQFCSILVNYDLPWNPMQVEQRIGRLDRFGQLHKRIRIYNFFIAETIETRIFQRLYERIGIFEQSIGDLEAILGEVIRELSDAVIQQNLTVREQEQLAEQMADRIIRLQLEREKFDQQKELLLGQDGIFMEHIEEMVGSGRYINSSEVCALVKSFLAEQFPRVRFQRDEMEDCWSLYGDDELIMYLDQFELNHRQQYKVSDRFREALHRRAVSLTFDNELARRRPLLEFVTIRHILAGAALDYWRSKLPVTIPATTITISGPPAERGHGYFFIYQVMVSGAQQQSSLHPIILLKNQVQAPETTKTFFAHLSHEATIFSKTKHADDEFIQQEQYASQQMAMHRDRVHREVAQRNVARVLVQKTSIQTSFEAKIQRAQEQAMATLDERIRRMKQSEVKNLQLKMKTKLAELEKANIIDTSHRLVAGGYIEIR